MKNATTTIDLSPIDRMISFLTMRYAFRYNTVLSCTEYRPAALPADSFTPLRLADRLADIPFSAISSSFYNVDNERCTAFLEDMADFFTYLIYVCHILSRVN